ncbi:MAG: isopeptide-forming domain-containing fimbrial protein [Lachnospiraceae bacterium]|nr:isopeptide-forming domain-containing fimbrial protein [Lachnospiraceae bacterium]
MMRRFRKIAGLMLALVMAVAMSVTALAYTITIDNSTSGHTYEAYQIFTGDLTGNGTASDPYVLANIEWGSGVDITSIVDGKTLLEALKELTVSGTTPFASCTDAASVAEVLGSDSNNTKDSAVAQAFADIVSKYLTTTATDIATSIYNTSNYTISGLAAGYYLVKDKDNSLDGTDDAYTRYILEVVSDVTATPKSSISTVEKEVQEDSTGAWQDYADYSIGDSIPYKLTATLPSTLADYSTYQLIFTDTLSAGLTLDTATTGTIAASDVTVTVYPNASSSSGTEVGGGYTVSLVNVSGISDPDAPYYGGKVLTLTINDVKSLTDTSGDPISVTSSSVIVVTYSATLNNSAVFGNDGNANEVYLTYSNNPNGSGTGKTTTKEAVVFTFELDVTKVDGDSYDTGSGSYTTMLEDAEFVLYYLDASSEKHYVIVDSSGNVTGWTTYKTSAEGTPYASTLQSDQDGNFSITGLDAGTYYLEETKAPDGYNLLSNPVKIVITATYEDRDNDGVDEVSSLTVSVDDGQAAESTDADKSSVDVTIVNNAGTSMPSTGGIGTTIFYVIGTILVLLAAVLLITRSRMRKSGEQ